MTVARRPLGHTGETVPILGHGTVPLGTAGYDERAARPLLEGLLAAGVNLFDTAAAYGEAEARLGPVLEAHRDEVLIVTKTGMDVSYTPAWGPGDLKRLIARSLKRLRTTHVDILLLHTCELEELQHGEAIEVLQEAQRLGQTRFIGYSGDGADLAFAIRTGVFDVVEASYSLLDQANHDLIASAQAAGMGVLLKRPLANAVPGRTQPPDDDYAAAYWPRWQELALTPADVGDLPWLEVAIRFAAFAEGASSALVGSGSLAHMQAHIAAVAKGPLPAPIATRLRQRFTRVAHDRWPGLG